MLCLLVWFSCFVVVVVVVVPCVFVIVVLCFGVCLCLCVSFVSFCFVSGCVFGVI